MINFIKILGITAEVNTKILVLMLQYNGGKKYSFLRVYCMQLNQNTHFYCMQLSARVYGTCLFVIYSGRQSILVESFIL